MRRAISERRQGVGLRGSERIAALGGRLTIESSTPKGAVLEASLPLSDPGGGAH